MSPPTRAYRGPQGRGAEAGALASNIRRASRPAFLRYRSGDTCGFRAYVPARGGARVVAKRCGGRTSTRESRTRRLRSRARPFLPPLAVFHDSSKSSVASYSTASRFPSRILFVPSIIIPRRLRRLTSRHFRRRQEQEPRVVRGP